MNFFDDSPGDLDLFVRGDLTKLEFSHERGDPHALAKAVIYCLEQGIPVPGWAVPGAVGIMSEIIRTSRKCPRYHEAQTARAAAMHVAEDHLDFNFQKGSSATKGGVAKLAESILNSESVIRKLKDQGIALTPQQTDRVALKDWWYRGNAANRRKFSEPDFTLYGVFLEALDM